MLIIQWRSAHVVLSKLGFATSPVNCASLDVGWLTCRLAQRERT